LLSAYWPLTQGSTWFYNDVENGKSSTSTETIVRGTEAANGQRAYQRRIGGSTTLENFSPNGSLQIHATRESDGGLKFHPGILYPQFATLGAHSETSGTLDVKINNLLLKGTFHTEIRVLRKQQINVPAGTFSTIKIQVTMEADAQYHKNGHDVELKFSSSNIDWLGKGAGRVRSVGTTHSELVADGKRRKSDLVDKSALQSYSIAP
jgi:hypothetical protein